MAGLYIHVPFCKQACHYCNFHFSTSLRQKPAMLEALLQELALRADYLPSRRLDTVYLGGGTPSLLSASELERLFSAIHALYEVAPGAEITLEANPDDLHRDKLLALRDSPVNRLSIGVQAFSDSALRYMNRVHSATESLRAIYQAQRLGFEDLNIDLIYGIPGAADHTWQGNLQTAFGLGVPHVSCYCLTVEPQTALDYFVRTGKAPAVDEEQAARQFELLMGEAARWGYEHYEISNFARPGRYSRHNTAYWQGQPYIGIGPSAHSFDGQSRQWNVANNAQYIKALAEGQVLAHREILGQDERYNEYVMTSLRTQWGCACTQLRTLGEHYLKHFKRLAYPFLESGHLTYAEGHFRLTPSGRLMADYIASSLFV